MHDYLFVCAEKIAQEQARQETSIILVMSTKIRRKRSLSLALLFNTKSSRKNHNLLDSTLKSCNHRLDRRRRRREV